MTTKVCSYIATTPRVDVQSTHDMTSQSDQDVLRLVAKEFVWLWGSCRSEKIEKIIVQGAGFDPVISRDEK